MTFWYGSRSGSADPYHWLSDLAPDLSVNGFQDTCWRYIFISIKSNKTVEIKVLVFLTLRLMMEGSCPRWSGRLKTFRSTTLVFRKTCKFVRKLMQFFLFLFTVLHRMQSSELPVLPLCRLKKGKCLGGSLHQDSPGVAAQILAGRPSFTGTSTLVNCRQCCGSRIRWFFAPGSGISFFPDPKPIFLRAKWQFLSKFYNSLKICQNFFLQHFKNKIIFVATKKGMTKILFAPLYFAAVYGSGG